MGFEIKKPDVRINFIPPKIVRMITEGFGVTAIIGLTEFVTTPRFEYVTSWKSCVEKFKPTLSPPDNSEENAEKRLLEIPLQQIQVNPQQGTQGNIPQPQPQPALKGYLMFALNQYFEAGGKEAYILAYPFKDNAPYTFDLDALANDLKKLDTKSVHLMVVPDARGNVEILQTCKNYCEKHDMILIGDILPLSLRTMTVNNKTESLLLKDLREKFKRLINVTRANFALYGPWVKMKYGDRVALFPISPIIAGLYNAIDDKCGLQQAPAGYPSQLKDPHIVELEEIYNDDEMDLLSKDQINYVKDTEVGWCLWEDYCFTKDDDWADVNIARFLWFVKRTLRKNLQQFLFSPNNPDTLYPRLYATINDFLRNLWKAGILMGSTQDDAYLISIDELLNTPETIRKHEVNIHIALSIISPCKYINISIERI